jgi:hypothetical protein
VAEESVKFGSVVQYKKKVKRCVRSRLNDAFWKDTVRFN